MRKSMLFGLLAGASLLLTGASATHAQPALPTPTPAPAGSFESPPGSGCTLVPVAGYDSVYTVDTYYVIGTQLPGQNQTGGGPRCDAHAWTSAIIFLRFLGNPGIGVSMNNLYLNGGSEMPEYVLVAHEACGDNRGFACGDFAVLVPGIRSGEYWNGATAAAHSEQQTHTPPNMSPRASSWTWDFMGEEPQPVSDDCLIALPGDPCWGTDYVDYSLPIHR